MKNRYNKNGPVVTVILPTFNRPQYFNKALSSVLRQSYENIQVIVINDGGTDVSDIVDSFADTRIVFINRKQNRGKACSLNEAFEYVQGKYISYLDDDDLYYPNHVEILVDTLENRTDCGVAYSDLYKAYCRVSQDGSRQVLSKVVEVSKDFDRFFMLYFNHVLHVSLMHRFDLIEKTGPYNENLDVLIDWDMTRRLAFFTDFQHVYEITGEYYHPMGESDRISFQQRKDKQNYLKNVLAIRTTRPGKPWPKIKDMSIIFVSDKLDKQAGQTISSVWQNAFYPYKLYLPMSQAEFNRLNTDMPNLEYIPVNPEDSQAKKIDSALKYCEGEYITVVPSGFIVKDSTIENSLYALMNCKVMNKGYLLGQSEDNNWAAVFRKEDLISARRNFRDLPILDSLNAAGMKLEKPEFEELPFQFDNMLRQAFSAKNDGDWLLAAQIYEHIAGNHQNELWMKRLTANALYKAGNKTLAAEYCRQLNQERPTIDTLLLEAKIKREEKEYDYAIELLTSAQRSIEGQDYLWT